MIEARPARQRVLGDVQNMVALVIRKVDFEDIHAVIDGVDQPGFTPRIKVFRIDRRSLPRRPEAKVGTFLSPDFVWDSDGPIRADELHYRAVNSLWEISLSSFCRDRMRLPHVY